MGIPSNAFSSTAYEEESMPTFVTKPGFQAKEFSAPCIQIYRDWVIQQSSSV